MAKLDDILATASKAHKRIEVKDERLGGDGVIYMRELNELEVRALDDLNFLPADDNGIRKPKGDGRNGANWIVVCAVDADGQRIFSTEHVDAIMRFPGSLYDKLLDAAHLANGRGDSALENAAKN